MNIEDFCRTCGFKRILGILAFVPVVLLLWIACHFLELKWAKELHVKTSDGNVVLKTGMTKPEVERLLNTHLNLSKIGHSSYSFGMHISADESYVLNFKGDRFLDGGRVGEDGHRGRILPEAQPSVPADAASDGPRR